MNNIEKALLIAEKIHRNQTYSIFPYIFHIKEVLEISEELDCDEETKVACVLHDSNLSYNDIKKNFGVVVAEIVYAVTDELGKNQKEIKEKTYPKIRNNWRAVIVKLCDRIANMRFSKNNDSKKYDNYVNEAYDFRKNITNKKHLKNKLINDKLKVAWKLIDIITGPYIKIENGITRYFNKGKLHRDGDLPAVINKNGDQEWWLNGERHRDGDLPAVINKNGNREWWLNGERHRDGDLPAVINNKSGGNPIRHHVNEDKKLIISLMPEHNYWFKNGKLHRKNKPAVISVNGEIKMWYYNDKLHRKNGPAIIFSDGTQEWWLNGKVHREDGPAVIDPNGDKAWYKNGKIIKK